MNKPRWTAEADADLERLAEEGLSGSQIAERMGKTRNAVIARAIRMGIELQGNAQRRHRVRAPKITLPLAKEISADLEQFPDGATLSDLTDWLGEPPKNIGHAIRHLFMAGRVAVRAA